MVKHYALYKDGVKVGEFTAKQIADKLAISKATVYYAKQHHATVQKHYTIEEGLPGGIEPDWYNRWKVEWDLIRTKINPNIKLERNKEL